MSFEGEIFKSPKQISTYFINDDYKVIEKKRQTLLIDRSKTSKSVEKSKMIKRK